MALFTDRVISDLGEAYTGRDGIGFSRMGLSVLKGTSPMRPLLLLLFILWTSLAQSQDRGIPVGYMDNPAVDLTRNGKLLMPDEVHELHISTKGRFDISTLDPVETSDLWKNTMLRTLPEDKNPLGDMDEVSYHSPVISPSGIFRFNIHNPGDSKLYTMMLSKNVHTVLLAKSLLRKLGYQIPDIKYLPRIILKFKSEQQKKGFYSYLDSVAMAGNPKSWVVEELEDNRVILQDLVIMESNHIIYNLAVGVTEEMIQGRRLLSSLSIPLTTVNLQESVNMLRWNGCHTYHGHVILMNNEQSLFQTSWEDARWATRRMEKLTRDDWESIVASSHLPKPVQQILVEKVISRRNSMMKCFKVDSKEIKVDGDVSNGIELVDGKITQQDWPGYASRFAHGDPDSPLSDADIKTWVKSRAISTLIEVAVAQINQTKYLGTDIAQINSDHFKVGVEEALKKSIADQTPFELPVKSWVFPTLRGQLILNRNLVTGTYLGTDNLVQMVDSVGVAVGGGLFAGTMGHGIKTAKKFMPINIGGNAEVMLLRNYSHLRPIGPNLKKSLAYPFTKMFVPLVKMDYGKKLHAAVETMIDPSADEDTRIAKTEEALRPFKDAINIGESLIVTDSVISYASAKAGMKLYGNLFSVSLGLIPGHTVVSRFHVHRKSENVFQVYKDIGHKGSIGVNFGLESLVPVLKLSIKESKGQAKVKFFNLDLDPNNPKVLKNASALRKAIVNSSTGEMEENDIIPFVVKHKFQESVPQMKLLFWNWIKQNSSTDIAITNPKGDERLFRRQYHGMTQGRNYQAYVNEVIGHWVDLLFDRKAGLSESTGTNPGFSFKGRAKTKFLTLDQEIGENKTVMEPFIKLTRIWNGWSIDRKKAEAILRELSDRYRFNFYNAPVLNDTRKIYMYSISMNALFYEKGIQHLMNLKEKEIREIFRKNLSQDSLVINPENVDDEDTGVEKFLRFMNKFKKLSDKRNKDDKANKYLLKALSHAENSLHLSGLSALMGGDHNIFVTSRIDGFREGDEAGDREIVSNSLGEFGSPRTLGPIVQVQRQTEMLEGEFFVYWMMTRLF